MPTVLDFRKFLCLSLHQVALWPPADLQSHLTGEAYTGQQETLLPCQALVPTQLQ